jgi:hypothetical protein
MPGIVCGINPRHFGKTKHPFFFEQNQCPAHAHPGLLRERTKQPAATQVPPML